MIGCTLLAGALALGTPTPHPLHATLAEIELNRASGQLEIALEVDPTTLEDALTRLAKLASPKAPTRIDLDRTADVDRRIADYLRSRFVVVRADGTPAELSWVGKDVGITTAWLFFELDVGSSLAECTLDQRVLFELEPTQTNTVTVVDGTFRRTWTFRGDLAQPPWVIRPPTSTPARIDRHPPATERRRPPAPTADPQPPANTPGADASRPTSTRRRD